MLEQATGPRPWERVALTAAQAAGLPVVTKTDRRYSPPRPMPRSRWRGWGRRTVLGLVRAALDRFLPTPLDKVREQEKAQRDAWRQVLEAGL